MKVLILGHDGMLGHMLHKILVDNDFYVYTINSRWPTAEFYSDVHSFDGDYIINCIGAIPQRNHIFDINHLLPIWLCDNIERKIIHPGTDCEMDHDAYGISKKTARDYIVNNSKNTKIIRSSIIGPELNNSASLLEWFLSSSDQVYGYTNAMWNGITTYEWAYQCIKLMMQWDDYATETIVSSNCISKYTLLSIINSVFDKNINILPVNKGEFKCLTGGIITLDIEDQLRQLKKYYYDNRC